MRNLYKFECAIDNWYFSKIVHHAMRNKCLFCRTRDWLWEIKWNW